MFGFVLFTELGEPTSNHGRQSLAAQLLQVRNAADILMKSLTTMGHAV